MALHFANGIYMSIEKCISTVLSVIIVIFITYYSVIMLNQIDVTTSIQTILKVFIIFSIIYTCGKVIPYSLMRVISVVKTFIGLILKGQSNTKPFN